MFMLRAAVLLAAFTIAALPGVSSPATAADFCCASTKDMPPPPPPPGRAVYLKGTLGMGTGAIGSMYNSAYAGGGYTVTHKELKSAPFAAIGIGIERGHWFRFDVTGEYRGNIAFSGQDRYSSLGGGGNDMFGDMSAWIGLANAYIDITTWRGITPYVGAGIGVANVEFKGFRDAGFNGTNGASLAFGQDHSQTNFAWALYAGISYDVTPQFTMDFGYRYLDLGDVRTGVVSTVDGGASIPYHELRDVVSHDLMLSARYRLDAPQPVYGGPMVMK